MGTRLTIALLLLGAACGKHEAAKAAEAMADEVCACPDAACATAAHKKGFEKVMKHMGQTGTRADGEAIEAAGKRVQACMAALPR